MLKMYTTVQYSVCFNYFINQRLKFFYFVLLFFRPRNFHSDLGSLKTANIRPESYVVLFEVVWNMLNVSA